MLAPFCRPRHKAPCRSGKKTGRVCRSVRPKPEWCGRDVRSSPDVCRRRKGNRSVTRSGSPDRSAGVDGLSSHPRCRFPTSRMPVSIFLLEETSARKPNAHVGSACSPGEQSLLPVADHPPDRLGGVLAFQRPVFLLAEPAPLLPLVARQSAAALLKSDKRQHPSPLPISWPSPAPLPPLLSTRAWISTRPRPDRLLWSKCGRRGSRLP